MVDLTRLNKRFASGQCYIECGSGWHEIIADLDTKLSKLDKDYTIQQIKEKFGALRFYAAGSWGDQGWKCISEAEDESSTVCEDCGSRESVAINTGDGSYWIRTLCAACRVRDNQTAAKAEEQKEK